MAFDATIREYLKEIDESPLLTWEEEKALAYRVIEDNDPEARERLVSSNLRLVVNIAKRFSGRGMTLGDLIEEGNLGLLRAVDTFDPEHGVRFSTYSSWWIKQSIKRAILANAQPIHIPTYMVELINQWRYTVSELEPQFGRQPTLEEMAKAMKVPLRKAKAIQQIVDVVNAGFQGDNADETSGLTETIQDDRVAAPEDMLGTSEELKKAVRLLKKIDSREAEVLTLRFGLNDQEPLTLKQIGKKMRLTRERVRQIQRNALERLNELMTS
ncbi:MAG TPA: sigma-70 family RNA polymerase sigma factor [Anaerohalosphaeraceae bacterium]|jgi:RNA polymerase sigma factor (sigma-70 family)|nr:sigma-70 family RNA polymerase sigma factor [Anaerohalosphaeraceae bacterium]HRT49490.1 sigma-70 family RNA polymerase sigma factor [Anaerohalosphaeraceae bacterium]HRT85348.1 sigma-70 family RNA polymerase sigma factor [Anaerohalosphaeraceae bacterium]